MYELCSSFGFFFFNDTATTEIYTLSLHDALPISLAQSIEYHILHIHHRLYDRMLPQIAGRDRKSTRLNSSHSQISYAVFCLKKKTPKHRPSDPYLPIQTPTVLRHRRACSGT